MRPLSITLLVVAAIAALMYFGDTMLPGQVEFGSLARAFIQGVFIIAILGYLLVQYRGKLSSAALSAFAWAGIFGIAIVGYTYRAELTGVGARVMDEVVPGREVKSVTGEATAVRGANGHFEFSGITNGVDLRYVFDTGASTVVLRFEDAKRIGLDTDKLDFSITVSTANGKAVTAPVTLDALSIGNITQRKVRALVARPGAMRDNLLGMSYLGRLKGYAVEGNRLVLRE